MHCPHCGAENPADAKHCGDCGEETKFVSSGVDFDKIFKWIGIIVVVFIILILLNIS